MGLTNPIWASPTKYLRARNPEESILFLDPAALAQTYLKFRSEFPGLTTYAVKANPDPHVIKSLALLGVHTFDVASPAEIDLVRSICPKATLHYHNPIRSRHEIRAAAKQDVQSYSVDCASELIKLAEELPERSVEIAVRFALPLDGASYDFGSKFGATPDHAVDLLRQATNLGFQPTLTFHPGTQCTAPSVWTEYIRVAADIANRAGITLSRLNVGGGFPCGRDGLDHDLSLIFQSIADAQTTHFPSGATEFVCEPGRALVSDAFSLAIMVKAKRGGDLFLADGVYGSLSEQNQIGLTRKFDVVSTETKTTSETPQDWRVFGPTCDSLDVLFDHVPLPGCIDEGDYVLFHSLGAYSTAMATRFNGYGQAQIVTVDRLTDS